MIKQLWNTLSITQAFALLALGCTGLLGFGMYLQHVVGLEPCPMCIVQRYAMTGIAFVALLAVFWHTGWFGYTLTALGTSLAAGGAFVAARQSWLQWSDLLCLARISVVPFAKQGPQGFTDRGRFPSGKFWHLYHLRWSVVPFGKMDHRAPPTEGISQPISSSIAGA